MTWLWRWRTREQQAAQAALEAQQQAEQAQLEVVAAEQQLDEIKAQRPDVERLAEAVTHQTVVLNGWTAHAKRAFS